LTSKAMNISGSTRIFAILADPIEQVMTPEAINHLFSKQGLNGVMVPLQVSSENLSIVVSGLRAIKNLDGFVVTVPHKVDMFSLCDQVTDEARAIGAVNVVHRSAEGRLLGAMFDGQAFVGGLQSAGLELEGRSVYLCGAGGAASAIAIALSKASIARLTIFNRTVENANQLLKRLTAINPAIEVQLGTSDPSGHDLVVNATSLGMKISDQLPCDADKLTANQCVAEIIMKPAETRLLSIAQERGCKVYYGAPMLSAQIQLMADFMRNGN